MKRIAIGLLVFSVIGTLGQSTVAAAEFNIAPPTRGMERNTGYTLLANELQLGVLLVEEFGYIVHPDIYVEAGISDSLQLGMAVLTTLNERPHGWLSTSNELSDELSFGASLGFRYRPARRLCPYSWCDRRPNRLYGSGEFCVSFTGEEDVIGEGRYFFHAGLQIRVRVDLEAPRIDYVRYSPYGMLHVEVADGIMALGEISYNPNFMRIGALMRVWDFLDLRATVNPFDLSAQFGADMRIRFGGVE